MCRLQLPYASATRGTFLFTLATQHFFLMLQGLQNQNIARVGFATKSLGQHFIRFIELNILQHVVDIGDTWLHVQPPSTAVAEQLEDVKMPVQVENRKCSHGFRQYFTCCYVARYVVNLLSDHGYQPIRLQDSGKVHR